MMAARPALLLAVVAALACGLVTPAAAKAPAVTATVTVVDIAFVPPRLTVAPGTTVRWHWSSVNFERHRVVLVHGPRGVHRFRSRTAAKDFTFSRRLSRSGTYRLVCSYHPRTMHQTITVR